MSVKDIEALLDGWRTRLAAASRNVSDLGDIAEAPQHLLVRLRTRTRPEPPGTDSNRTNAAARAWRATQDELWECVRLVGEAIDRADRLVKDAWPWAREAAAAEARLLLAEGTIELQVADVPVLRRGILGNSRDVERLTLDRMIEVMDRAFERSKASLVALAEVDRRLDDGLAGLERDVTWLEANGWPGAAAARDLAAGIAALAQEDPLRAEEELAGRVRPAVQAALDQAEAARRSSAEAAADLVTARAALAELVALEARSETVSREFAAKVSGVPVSRADRVEAAELPGWLDRLARLLADGKVDAFRVGIARWRAMHGRAAAALMAEEDGFRAALGRRDELRARFETVRAKRNARLAAGAPDFEGGIDAADRIKAMLFGAVTPLSEAERLLSEFETRVARMSAPRQR